MTFLSIAIRGAQKTDPSWWNSLRSAGIRLEQILGLGAIIETAFTIANNTGPANVTGLSFSGAAIRSFVVDFAIYRNTTGAGATERSESGQLFGVYKSAAATWEMSQGPGVGDAGVAFSITAAGQIQYTSDNQTGTAASSLMKFSARTLSV